MLIALIMSCWERRSLNNKKKNSFHIALASISSIFFLRDIHYIITPVFKNSSNASSHCYCGYLTVT